MRSTKMVSARFALSAGPKRQRRVNASGCPLGDGDHNGGGWRAAATASAAAFYRVAIRRGKKGADDAREPGPHDQQLNCE